jgi:hypothetical protein
VKDIQHQLDWYTSQGMLKTEVKADAVIDMGRVVALP